MLWFLNHTESKPGPTFLHLPSESMLSHPSAAEVCSLPHCLLPSTFRKYVVFFWWLIDSFLICPLSLFLFSKCVFSSLSYRSPCSLSSLIPASVSECMWHFHLATKLPTDCTYFLLSVDCLYHLPHSITHYWIFPFLYFYSLYVLILHPRDFCAHLCRELVTL